jgi:hypothetical protein
LRLKRNYYGTTKPAIEFTIQPLKADKYSSTERADEAAGNALLPGFSITFQIL